VTTPLAKTNPTPAGNHIGTARFMLVSDSADRYARGWPADYETWRELDQNGKSEFLGIVEQIV
jgi:hypothetical protein